MATEEIEVYNRGGQRIDIDTAKLILNGVPKVKKKEMCAISAGVIYGIGLILAGMTVITTNMWLHVIMPNTIYNANVISAYSAMTAFLIPATFLVTWKVISKYYRITD